jgi:hypothetical protein
VVNINCRFEMNQADVTKLMSRLRIKYKPVRRKLKNIEGPEGRLKKIQKTLTALIKHERIELNFNRGDETRGYVERVSTCRIMLIGPVFWQFLYTQCTFSVVTDSQIHSKNLKTTYFAVRCVIFLDSKELKSVPFIFHLIVLYIIML